MWVHRNDSLHSTPTIHEREGLPQLKLSSAQELGTGLHHLPPLYRSYFNLTLEQLLAKPVDDLRAWFHTVRLAREVTDQNIQTDPFTTNGPLRAWVGLPVIRSD